MFKDEPMQDQLALYRERHGAVLFESFSRAERCKLTRVPLCTNIKMFKDGPMQDQLALYRERNDTVLFESFSRAKRCKTTRVRRIIVVDRLDDRSKV